MSKMLITGATGFIGHFLVKEFINDYEIICIVRPGTKNLERLTNELDRITVIEHDLKSNYDNIINYLKDVEIILHAGGNPSSEASILDPVSVVMDNVLGTVNLLELARKLPLKRFFYYSAGEIFGPITPNTDSNENDCYNSVSPYAASKASGEELCVSYSHTFGIPISITHITNTFGQRCQSNRLTVIAIRKLLAGEPLTIHVDSTGNIGGRRWLHAADIAGHTRFILDNQKNICEKWNSVGPKFITNLELVQQIANILDKPLEYNFVPIQRLGHNPWFSMSPEKLYNAGWKEPKTLNERLHETVEWYIANPSWLTRD